jgi:propionyl-CoA synthetase
VLSKHPDVCEVAVVGVKHSLKGEIPMGFIIRHKHSSIPEGDLEKELISRVRNEIGPVAVFKSVHFVSR